MAGVHVARGAGGNGCVTFRRKKGVTMEGSNGGHGGSGGAVLFHADEALKTLAGLRSKVHVKGRPGKNEIGKNKDGQDTLPQVPRLMERGVGQRRVQDPSRAHK